jgi:CRP-like cAMP-binding protein
MRNRLLDALPRAVYRDLEGELERKSLARGTVLHHPGDTIRHLYFPLNCLVSITVTMAEGKTAETGVVGNSEVVGINAFMGGSETTQTEYVVQVEGDAFRMQAQPLLKAFDGNKAVRKVLLKYTQAMIAQLSQNAACARLHNVNQRYARWLLEARDRIQTDDLRLTHKFIGQMLGVRRATVTETAAKLEEEALISVRRGLARIRDGKGLARVSCECYGVVKAEYDRLLGTALSRGDGGSKARRRLAPRQAARA